ncbi:acyl-CoA dehydrogenase family protein [Vulcanisaeta sp. JCM 16159]|uniref:acyl-CoA dehydrogenase family protein n=1 Tax=Vulcanisaeta sp. JCM 16159 TaxID=1295371 RepID=UPI000A7DE9D3|nr:acyl-CoA dehydrogenase family protein [Vulcanisaeta sp. JCM 16159]
MPETELEGFRNYVRDWFIRNAPPEMRIRRGGIGWYYEDPKFIDAAIKWHRTLYEAGLVGISWPKEYGGLGDDVRKELIVRDVALSLVLFILAARALAYPLLARLFFIMAMRNRKRNT